MTDPDEFFLKHVAGRPVLEIEWPFELSESIYHVAPLPDVQGFGIGAWALFTPSLVYIVDRDFHLLAQMLTAYASYDAGVSTDGGLIFAYTDLNQDSCLIRIEEGALGTTFLGGKMLPLGYAELPNAVVVAIDEFGLLCYEFDTGEVKSVYPDLEGLEYFCSLSHEVFIVSSAGKLGVELICVGRSGEIVRSIALGLRPDNIQVDRLGKWLLVTGEAGDLVLANLSDGKIYKAKQRLASCLSPLLLEIEPGVSCDIVARVKCLQDEEAEEFQFEIRD